MAGRMLALIDRVVALAGYQRQVGGARWYWPGWGQGDRGPPGNWQMNRNMPPGALDLLAFSAVYACVNTIAADVSKLPVEVYAVDLESGARLPRRTDYYAQLFR